jgi:hypothetical protein
VLGIVSDQNELSNSLGIPGTSGAATLKELGISRPGAIQSGGGILKDMVNIAETISPISRCMTPQSMFLNPSELIAPSLEPAQLERPIAAGRQQRRGSAGTDECPRKRDAPAGDWKLRQFNIEFRWCLWQRWVRWCK